MVKPVIHHSVSSEDFDTLLRGYTFPIPQTSVSIDLDSGLLMKLQDHLMSESEDKPDQTRIDVLKEHIGLATDDELCNIAARALQGLKDRGYKVSATEAIAPLGTPPSKPAHAFVVTIAKTFRSDDPE